MRTSWFEAWQLKKRRKHRDWQKNGNVFFCWNDGGEWRRRSEKKRGFNKHMTYIYIYRLYFCMGSRGIFKASQKSNKHVRWEDFSLWDKVTFFDGTVNDFSGRFLSVYVFWSQPATVGGREIFFCNILLPRASLRCQCGKTEGLI